ncbi:MAG: hypothetical protein ACO1Q7_20600 [Gemmatimonas sp.]
MTSHPPVPELDWAWFFDIDGTLAQLEMSPDAVRVDGVMQYLIAALHEKTEGAVALISGRAIRDIDHLFPNFQLAAAGQSEVCKCTGEAILAKHSPAEVLTMKPEDGLPLMKECAAKSGLTM